MLSPFHRSVLLVHHRKLGRWLQPGGHADGEADLLQVALREAREETALEMFEIPPADSPPAPLDVDIEVQEGDTDNTPYGLGTYASRSTPVAGAATSVVSRKLRDKAREIAGHLLEASADDIEFEAGRFFVKGSPEQVKTIQSKDPALGFLILFEKATRGEA